MFTKTEVKFVKHVVHYENSWMEFLSNFGYEWMKNETFIESTVEPEFYEPLLYDLENDSPVTLQKWTL